MQERKFHRSTCRQGSRCSFEPVAFVSPPPLLLLQQELVSHHKSFSPAALPNKFLFNATHIGENVFWSLVYLYHLLKLYPLLKNTFCSQS